VSRRVLIVEDDKHFASQLKELMEFGGHDAVLAYTGPDGVDAFEHHRPDFVLMDVMLPNLHGIRVLEKIRRLPGGSDVPAILMSAVYRSDSIFKKDMLRLGVIAFLSKPFSMMDLGRKIERVLEMPDGGREQVRAIFDEAAAASITGAFRAVTEDEAEGKTAADLPSGAHGLVEDDSDSAGVSYSEIPAVMAAAPAPLELPEGDSFVRVDTSRRLPRVGTLTPDSYVRMVTTLFHAHSSGRFMFEHDGPTSRRTLYLLNGYPVWVDTADPMAGLPRFLRDDGQLSASQIAGLETVDGSTELRAQLLSRGLISPAELDASLEAWVEAEVRDGLARGGNFRFTRGDDFAGSVPVYEVNPIRALWEGVVRHVPLDTIRRELDLLGDRSVGRTPTYNRLFGYIGSSPALRALGESLLRPRPVSEARARFADSDGTVARCLWFMVHAGLVALSDTPAAAASRAAKPDRKPAPPARPRPTSEPARRPAPTGPTPSQPVASSKPAEHTVEFTTGSVGADVVSHLRKATAPVPSSPADHAALIVRDYVTRMDQDHYGFLSVETDASMEEIDAAYGALAPRYRLRNLDADVGGDVRRKAKELLARLVQAFDELSDPARRRTYDARMERIDKMAESTGSIAAISAADFDAVGPELDEVSDGAAMSLVMGPDDLGSTWWPGAEDPAVLSKRRRRLGKEDGGVLVQAHQAMARTEFHKAAPVLESLRHKFPSDPGILADLGWCRFASAPNDSRTADKALEWVDLALAFEPDYADALEVRARILTASPKRKADAIKALRRLLRIRKDSEWGRSELRRLDRDKPDGEDGKKKRGLGRLLGRG